MGSKSIKKVSVLDKVVSLYLVNAEDYISLTDIAKFKNPDAPADIIKNWLRSKNTIELLGLWEKLHNEDFKLVEFDQFKNDAGFNHFVLSPKKWIEATHAIGLQSKSGRYGGTFAHADIALEFASWVSVEFKFYLLKEFQRLKKTEAQAFDWSVKRSLSKINYRIHTDAIKAELIPAEVSKAQAAITYASEADLLNVALFGQTAKQWRDVNPKLKGNIRDHSSIEQLLVLANIESMNAEFIHMQLSASDRLLKLNTIAIRQMQSLTTSAQLTKQLPNHGTSK